MPPSRPKVNEKLFVIRINLMVQRAAQRPGRCQDANYLITLLLWSQGTETSTLERCNVNGVHGVTTDRSHICQQVSSNVYSCFDAGNILYNLMALGAASGVCPINIQIILLDSTLAVQIARSPEHPRWEHGITIANGGAEKKYPKRSHIWSLGRFTQGTVRG